jgi:hypothetical protein
MNSKQAQEVTCKAGQELRHWYLQMKQRQWYLQMKQRQRRTQPRPAALLESMREIVHPLRQRWQVQARALS